MPTSAESIIDALYEATMVPEMWRPTLARASRWWGADAVALTTHPDALGGYVCTDTADELMDAYTTQDWCRRDVRAERGIPFLRKGADVVTDQDIFTPEEMERLPYFSDFVRRCGFGWFAATMVADTNGTLIALSLVRRSGKEPFEEPCLRGFRQALPHLRRVGRLAARARHTTNEDLLRRLDDFALGAIIIDRQGKSLLLNGKAESMMGSDLRITRHRLRAAHRASDDALQTFLDACATPDRHRAARTASSAVIHRRCDLPLIIESYPIVGHACDVFQGGAALLVLTDPAAEAAANGEVLQQAFRLTPAEVRTATAFLKGWDTNETALSFGVAPQTIRFHLKALFAKTGTGHQAELVALLNRFSHRARN